MAKEGKKKNPILKVLKVIGIVLLIIVLLEGGLFAWLTVKEYKPEDVEAAQGETVEFFVESAWRYIYNYDLEYGLWCTW